MEIMHKQSNAPLPTTPSKCLNTVNMLKLCAFAWHICGSTNSYNPSVNNLSV